MTASLTPFSLRVTATIKAELARRDHSGADLIPVLRLGKNALYARLRGEKSWELEEIAKIAEFLGLGEFDLLTGAVPTSVARAA